MNRHACSFALVSLLGALPLACAAPGDDPEGAAPEGPIATTASEYRTTGRCGAYGAGNLLECSNGCPNSLFSEIALNEDFAGQNAYAANWSPSFVQPTLAAGGLTFGAHPASPNWWEMFSPTGTKRADFGDVLMCVRLKMTTGGVPGANAFQISLRGGSEGMVLTYGSGSQAAYFATKTSAADTWVTHDSKSFPLPAGEHTLEFALYGRDTSFFGEVKDLASGKVATVRANYGLPRTGPVELLGWKLSAPLIVTNVVVGTPTSLAQHQLGAD